MQTSFIYWFYVKGHILTIPRLNEVDLSDIFESLFQELHKVIFHEKISIPIFTGRVKTCLCRKTIYIYPQQPVEARFNAHDSVVPFYFAFLLRFGLVFLCINSIRRP
jgi:hypothetical protein